MSADVQESKDFVNFNSLQLHIQCHLASVVGAGTAERLKMSPCPGGCEAYCTAAKLEFHRIDGCPSLANSSIRKADIAAMARARREEAVRAAVNGGLGPRGAPPTPPARPALRRSQRAPQSRVQSREDEAEEDEAVEVEE